MSKLTNCQICAMIRGLKDSARKSRLRGDRIGFLQRQVLIAKYEAELRERKAAGLNPGTEIQIAHIERRHAKA